MSPTFYPRSHTTCIKLEEPRKKCWKNLWDQIGFLPNILSVFKECKNGRRMNVFQNFTTNLCYSKWVHCRLVYSYS